MSFSRQNEILEQTIGNLGGKYIADTNAHTGKFCAIQVIADCVITLVGNITGITSVSLPAGIIIYGRYTSVTLASGSVFVYNSGI